MKIENIVHIDKVSKKSDFVEVKFIWSYEGKTLPAGENIYSIENKKPNIFPSVCFKRISCKSGFFTLISNWNPLPKLFGPIPGYHWKLNIQQCNGR